MATNFRDIVDSCGASALARCLNLQVNTVQKWRDRDNIPAEHWPRIIEIFNGKGWKLNADRLMYMAARKATPLRPNPKVQAKARRPRLRAAGVSASQ